MPETTDYMLMGYAAAFIILAITIGSVWLRYQMSVKDEALLEELENNEAHEPVTPSTVRGPVLSEPQSQSAK